MAQFNRNCWPLRYVYTGRRMNINDHSVLLKFAKSDHYFDKSKHTYLKKLSRGS